jgi:hypothetical protein
MQLNHTLRSSPVPSKKEERTSAKKAASTYIVDEINAYISIRDGLLLEAEQLMTRAKIDSAAVANDFVITCLRPPRPPYEAQCLPKADAARERKRCEQVNARIAELYKLATARQKAREYAATH